MQTNAALRPFIFERIKEAAHTMLSMLFVYKSNGMPNASFTNGNGPKTFVV